MSIEAVPKKRVEKDVIEAFKLLAESEGIKINNSDFPVVEVREGKYSYYDLTKRSIFIRPLDIGSGTTYFEEAGHALRDVVQRRKGVDYLKQDRKVHEFLGRAAESIGRDLSSGTEMMGLFSEKPRDMDDPRIKKKLLNRLRGIRDVKDLLRERRDRLAKGRSYALNLLKENYLNLQDAYKSFRSGKINEQEFISEMHRLEQESRKGARKLSGNEEMSVSPFDENEIKGYLSLYEYLGEVLGITRNAKDEEKRKIIDGAMKFVDELYNPKKIKFDLDDPRVLDVEFQIGEIHDSHEVHRKPYLYAQQYAPSELKGAYSLSDSEIRDRFFHKRKSGLEKAVETLFFVLFPLVFVYLLKLRLTGFVSGVKLVKLDLFLLIFLIIISILYLKFRTRK
ncbi:hypothetical protein HYW76_00330 [Candidatus Pacearchaeota archaeon]|nr:hypothetical protein [Candidatus Pacearchaeota archaeon]